jgi:putative acetyltransferase
LEATKLNFTAVDPAESGARALLRERERELDGNGLGITIDGVNPGEFTRGGGYFVLVRRGRAVVGCGGYRPLDCNCAEIRWIFVRRALRRRGLEREVLRHLEREVRRCGYLTAVVEANERQSGLIALCEQEGYFPIPPFLDYAGVPSSRCFAKRI